MKNLKVIFFCFVVFVMCQGKKKNYVNSEYQYLAAYTQLDTAYCLYASFEFTYTTFDSFRTEHKEEFGNAKYYKDLCIEIDGVEYAMMFDELEQFKLGR